MRSLRNLLLALALLLGVAVPAGADTLVDLPNLEYARDGQNNQLETIDRKIRYVVYPVLGCPSIAIHGDTIPIRIDLQDGGNTSDFQAKLITTRDPNPRVHTLRLGPISYDANRGIYTVTAHVDPTLPEDTYDLEISSGSFIGGSERSPNSVRILRTMPDDYRIVHLADTQLQDPSAFNPQIVRTCLEEIRLLDPVFCIYSGDLNFGANYQKEWRENYALFKKAGIPIFFVPGNHDGYATVKEDSSGNPVVHRDGLNHWRQTIGPTYFSIEFGEYHFSCINSYEGSAQRRNSKSFWVINFGGQLDQSQINWFEQDALAATARGKKVIAVTHHDPTAPIVHNRPAYPFPWALPSWQEWNDPHSQDELMRIFGSTDVVQAWSGHIHEDKTDDHVLNPGTPNEKSIKIVRTTTPNATVHINRWGYRVVEVRGGQIARIHYKGKQQESVPLDPAGILNFDIQFDAPNDGTRVKNRVVVSNLLEVGVSLRIAFRMAPSQSGWKATGGTIDQVTRMGNGEIRVEVVVPLQAMDQQAITVEQDKGGAQPGYIAPAAGQGQTGPGSTGGSAQQAAILASASGSGSSGCALRTGRTRGTEWLAFLLLTTLFCVARGRVARIESR